MFISSKSLFRDIYSKIVNYTREKTNWDVVYSSIIVLNALWFFLDELLKLIKRKTK